MTPKFLGAACVLMATLIWSGNFILARGLGDVLPPVTLAALRWITATLAVIPVALPAIRRQWPLIVKHKRHLCISALLGVTLFNTLIYQAGHTTQALNLSLIATTTPVFMVILSRIYLGEPISRTRAVGLLVAITGIVLLVTRGQLEVLRTLSFHEGDIWMLGAGFLWAVYSLILKKKPLEIDRYAYLGVTFFLGMLPLIPGALIEQTLNPQFSFTLPIVGAVLYVGLGASLAAFFLWTKAIELVGPTTATLIYYSLPAFCAVEAYLFLNEAATWAHGAGFLLIFTGIVLAIHPRFNS